MANIEEIKSIIKHIETHPEAWNQDSWITWEEGGPLLRDQVMLVPDYKQDGCSCMTCSSEVMSELLESGQPMEYRTVTISLIDLTEGFCGTAGCVAGHAVVRAGYRVGTNSDVYDHDNKFIGVVESVARRLLDLTEIEANIVFAGGVHRVEDLKWNITSATGITFDE